MAITASKKRKPTDQPNFPNARSVKRAKFLEARTILAQAPDKDLSKNGDLDVSAFVKSREFEIQALGKSMQDSKHVLSTRAFQQVPKDMRRRTASHNVKRVPKRLRGKAAREMRDDNTATGKARKGKLTPHQRLRLEKAKALKQQGAFSKKKRNGVKKQKPGETDPEMTVEIGPRVPKLKKDTLCKPRRPQAKFRKRQIHKSWLPTHIWHAKRAHMTEPKYPLWRFAISLTPTDKCFRTTHRAAAMRGCVAWDMSYMSTIGVEGLEASLLGVLRSIGVAEAFLSGRNGVKWRKGTRAWEGWIRERDRDQRWIAPVGVVWCADEDDKNAAERATTDRNKKAKRNILLRVHPSAFLQAWQEILKVAKMQRPPALIEDLRFEIGSIEITGPGSTEALIGALQPIPNMGFPPKAGCQPAQRTINASAEPPQDGEWVDLETPPQLWSQLTALTNPSALPANALLAFNVTDPRLHHPPRTITIPDPKTANETLLSQLVSWPPDQTQFPGDIFNRAKRFTASRLLASQKSINRRKAAALPGQYPDPLPDDPRIPILLLASRPAARNFSAQGTWTLLIPWDCVLPVWYSLTHYPLCIGGTPRFGCLQEKQQISLEQGSLWFPGDFPGTKAGWEWEMREREIGRKEWDKRPRGKRCEWTNIDLGEGRKGEIGQGWACDWERLLLGKEGVETAETAAKAKDREKVGGSDVEDGLASQPNDKPKETPGHSEPTEIDVKSENSEELRQPPYGIHHVPNPLVFHPTTLPSSTALTPVHIHHLTTGHPKRCARIYRLPTTNPLHRTRWLDLAAATTAANSSSPAQRRKAADEQPLPPLYPQNTGTMATAAAKKPHTLAHERAQTLAASLLCPSPSHAPPSQHQNQHQHQHRHLLLKPGDPRYPPIPEEKDLMGYITSANYQLGLGCWAAVGNVLVVKALGLDGLGNQGAGEGGGGGEGEDEVAGGLAIDKVEKRTQREEGVKARRRRGKDQVNVTDKDHAKLCIIRDAGQGFGRLARWRFAP
ncbi:MAG: hypothetical protein Q9163_004155 [Psora crenata]